MFGFLKFSPENFQPQALESKCFFNSFHICESGQAICTTTYDNLRLPILYAASSYLLAEFNIKV